MSNKVNVPSKAIVPSTSPVSLALNTVTSTFGLDGNTTVTIKHLPTIGEVKNITGCILDLEESLYVSRNEVNNLIELEQLLAKKTHTKYARLSKDLYNCRCASRRRLKEKKATVLKLDNTILALKKELDFQRGVSKVEQDSIESEVTTQMKLNLNLQDKLTEQQNINLELQAKIKAMEEEAGKNVEVNEEKVIEPKVTSEQHRSDNLEHLTITLDAIYHLALKNFSK